MQKQKGVSVLVGIIIIIFVAIVAFGGVFIYQYFSTSKENNQQQNQQTACTEEAKVCPDGSSVGRIGPNCEFAECPAVPDQTAGWKTYTNNAYNYQISYIPATTIEETAGNGLKIKYQNGNIIICSRSVGACGNVPGIVGVQPINREVNIDGKKYSISGYVYNGNESLYLSLPNNMFVYLGVPGQNIQTENQLLEMLSTFKFINNTEKSSGCESLDSVDSSDQTKDIISCFLNNEKSIFESDLDIPKVLLGTCSISELKDRYVDYKSNQVINAPCSSCSLQGAEVWFNCDGYSSQFGCYFTIYQDGSFGKIYCPTGV